MQIFPHSKFGINRTAGLKVTAKKFKFRPRNFLAITFKPAVRSVPNFECGKICKILGLFAKSVSPWSQQPGTLFSKVKIWRGELKTSGLLGIVFTLILCVITVMILKFDNGHTASQQHATILIFGPRIHSSKNYSMSQSVAQLCCHCLSLIQSKDQKQETSVYYPCSNEQRWN